MRAERATRYNLTCLRLRRRRFMAGRWFCYCSFGFRFWFIFGPLFSYSWYVCEPLNYKISFGHGLLSGLCCKLVNKQLHNKAAANGPQIELETPTKIIESTIDNQNSSTVASPYVCLLAYIANPIQSQPTSIVSPLIPSCGQQTTQYTLSSASATIAIFTAFAFANLPPLRSDWSSTGSHCPRGDLRSVRTGAAAVASGVGVNL